MDMIGSENLDVACDCGCSITRTIAQWRRSPAKCPRCNATIKVDTSELDKSVRNLALSVH